MRSRVLEYFAHSKTNLNIHSSTLSRLDTMTRNSTPGIVATTARFAETLVAPSTNGLTGEDLLEVPT